MVSRHTIKPAGPHVLISRNPTIHIPDGPEILPSFPEMVSPAHDPLRRLLEADRASEEFPRSVVEILDAQRRSISDAFHFNEDEVAQLIELIDTEVLRQETIPNELKGIAFSVLRRLCGTSQKLPNSCLVGKELKINGEIPFAKRIYSDLWRGDWNGKDVAVKLLRFSEDDDRAKITKRFCKEMVLWKKLHHINLLPFYGAYMTDRFGMVSPWFENGDIVGFTRRNPEVNRLCLLIGVTSGLEYLHRVGVTHGNLRGSNILVSDHIPPRAVLSDYGLTSIIFEPFSLTRESINWTAPELLTVQNDKRSPSFAGDVYGLAMVMYEVLTGAPPFANRKKSEVAFNVAIEGKRPPRPNNSKNLGITDDIWKLLELCWSKNPSSRPEVSRVAGHLKGAVKHWRADATSFLLASEAGVQEVMGMEPEKAQKIADDIDKALDLVGVSKSTRKYLRCLQKLCAVSGILPQSFVLAGELKEPVDKGLLSIGGHAYVYRATYEGKRVAVKVLRMETVGNPALTRTNLAKEVVGWKWLRHENILPFLGVTSMPQPFRMVSLWMENGNIVSFLRDNGEKNPFQLLVDVTNGLQFLHNHDFIHGDLKGANILIDSGHRARLADFGLARIIEDSNNSNSNQQSGQKMGTVRWSAPECLHPEKFGFGRKCRKRLPSKSTDIYALGMTILEVITQSLPFPHIKTEAVYMHVIEGGRPERPTKVFSDALWNLLEQSWHEEHETMLPMRPSICLLRAQLERDAGIWVSGIGLSGATTIAAEDPESSSDEDQDLPGILGEVQEILQGQARVQTAVPRRERGSQKKGAKGHVRRSSLQKIRDKFRFLLAKFTRANREPIMLSDGLTFEREDTGVAETNFVELFD